MGEYEPRDSRNVTGTAETPDGRWTAQGQRPPNAAGQEPPLQERGQGELGDGSIQFEADPQLAAQLGQAEIELGPVGEAEQGGQLYESGRSEQGGRSGIADQMDQGSQSIGQVGEGVAGAATQNNDHTSGIGQEQQDVTGQAGMTGWKTADTAGQIHSGQPVMDRDGQHVGTVDSLEGDRIKLARSDSADGMHHYVLASQVKKVERDEVWLSCTADAMPG